ncbi:MAG: hypothetical protein EBS20_05665, partial [Actinobacteria bacterium]|nr:hypothetical protein [Actinomycetota bacterium]
MSVAPVTRIAPPSHCRRTKRSTVAAFVLMGLLAACGGSDDPASSNDSTDASQTTSAPATTVLATTVPSTVAATTTTAPADTTTTTEVPASELTITVPTNIPAPAARTITELLALERPLIIAHAGGDQELPHSTPYAYARSALAGVDML